MSLWGNLKAADLVAVARSVSRPAKVAPAAPEKPESAQAPQPASAAPVTQS
jgi:hypothetical protein